MIDILVKRYRPMLLQEGRLSKLRALLDDPTFSRRTKIQIKKIIRLCKTIKYSTKSSKTSRKSKRKVKPDLHSELIAQILSQDGRFIPI